MFHCKVMIVDGLLVSVGSTNFDNALVPPERRGEPQRLRRGVRGAAGARCSSDDLSRSKVVTLAAWRDRPRKERAMEWFGQLLKSQL